MQLMMTDLRKKRASQPGFESPSTSSSSSSSGASFGRLRPLCLSMFSDENTDCKSYAEIWCRFLNFEGDYEPEVEPGLLSIEDVIMSRCRSHNTWTTTLRHHFSIKISIKCTSIPAIRITVLHYPSLGKWRSQPGGDRAMLAASKMDCTSSTSPSVSETREVWELCDWEQDMLIRSKYMSHCDESARRTCIWISSKIL